MLIDTHCHLQDPRFDADRPEVILAARRTGVERLITVGTDLETSRRAIRLAGEYPFLYATVGVHPHEVKSFQEDSYPELEALAGNPRVVAFGEIGLDDHYQHSPRDVQRKHFREQIRLAMGLRLPLVLHTRQAFPETLRILREEKADEVGGVFHCFTGDLEAAREAVSIGFFISFSGILTFRNARELQAVAREVPRDRLLVETDSPYLAPAPHRGRRNEPAYVRYVAEMLAGIQGLPTEETCRITTENARRAFPGIR